eukprot:14586377-Alexandrium_andersonii.AAC.1
MGGTGYAVNNAGLDSRQLAQNVRKHVAQNVTLHVNIIGMGVLRWSGRSEPHVENHALPDWHGECASARATSGHDASAVMEKCGRNTNNTHPFK